MNDIVNPVTLVDQSFYYIIGFSFVFLFIFGRFLRLFPSKEGKTIRKDRKKLMDSGDNFENKGNISAVVVSVVLLIFVGGLTFNTSALPPVKIKGGIKSFPQSFNDWKGQIQTIDPEIIEWSRVDSQLKAVIIHSTHSEISLKTVVLNRVFSIICIKR